MNLISQSNYIGFSTIVRKEIHRFMRIWSQTLLPSAITMTLYFIIFGKLIGSQIGQIDNHSYMQYIVPGLIMMSIINSAYANVATSFFSLKFQRSIEELLISPLPNSLVLLGFIIGGTTRGLLVGSIVALIACFFTSMSTHHLFITLFVAFLTAFCFSCAGFLNALFAKKFDDVMLIPTFILTPLTYLGGVFYSIHVLPVFWQWLTLLNPIFYLVNAFRYGILGIADIQIDSALLILCLFSTSLFFLCLYLLKRGYGIRH